MIWDPVDFFVVFDQTLFDRFYFNKPGGDGTVNERSIRSPAEWVAMAECCVGKHLPFLFKATQDHFVGILNVHPCKIAHLCSECPLLCHWADQRYPCLLTSLKILLSKCRCHMDNPGTCFGRNKSLSEYFKGVRLIFEIGK